MNTYEHELLPLLHRILEVSANIIHLQNVPNWPRSSLPKSPMVHKLGLIVIPVLYPWWCRELEIEYEQFGPYSPIIGSIFEELLDKGQCHISGNTLQIQPSSFEEKSFFPEITEKFIYDLLAFCNNPVLSQFETLEVFSIIAVEQEVLMRSQRILRRMPIITEELQKDLIQQVFQRMLEIPHLQRFIKDRGNTKSFEFISESIEVFYGVLSTYKLEGKL